MVASMKKTENKPRTFGEWLYHNRKARGWNQDELAAKVGRSKSYISALERDESHSIHGHEPKPTIETITRIANAFGIDPNIPQMIVYPIQGNDQDQPIIFSDTDGFSRIIGSYDNTMPDRYKTVELLREEAAKYLRAADHLTKTADNIEGLK